MSAAAVGLVAIAAVFHASWNLITKRTGGGLAFLWLFGVAGTVAMLPPAIVAAVRMDRPLDRDDLIAAVEGYALAGGTELALATDLIVAARDSAFGIPEARVRVIVLDTGSGYGGKHTGECAVEAARRAKTAGKILLKDSYFHGASPRIANDCL